MKSPPATGVGFPPALKIDGMVTPISELPLAKAHARTFARTVMNDRQLAMFAATTECNFAVASAGSPGMPA